MAPIADWTGGGDSGALRRSLTNRRIDAEVANPD
jgi:hypothetical protein